MCRRSSRERQPTLFVMNMNAEDDTQFPQSAGLLARDHMQLPLVKYKGPPDAEAQATFCDVFPLSNSKVSEDRVKSIRKEVVEIYSKQGGYG